MKKFDLNIIDSEEQFLIWLIGHMSDTFGPKVILRGGMILRLLDSPRETHDLDYAFTGFDSKKQIVNPIIDSFKDYEQIAVHHALHSTAARFDVVLNNDRGRFHVIVEARVTKDCPSISISTGQTATKYHLEPRLILTMKHEVALANKLAAWVERRLVRDLYDAYYYYRFVGIRPDLKTLSSRLKKLSYFDKGLRKTAPRSLSMNEFCDLIVDKMQDLDDKAIQAELVNLDPASLPGLSLKIRSALLEIADWIRDNQAKE
jgi:hypothetical protein